MPSLSAEQLAEIRTLLADEQKIMAIKKYRSLTGLSLRDAKEGVEAIADGHEPAAGAAPVTATHAGPGISGVEDLLRAGQKIAAIKLYRELTGLGLRESKEAVEAMGVSQPTMPATEAPPLPVTPVAPPAAKLVLVSDTSEPVVTQANQPLSMRRGPRSRDRYDKGAKGKGCLLVLAVWLIPMFGVFAWIVR